MKSREKAVVLLSGGLDSTTLFYQLAAGGFEVRGISVDYGQRHRKEMDYARRTADRLGARHDVVDLTAVTRFLTASALTSAAVAVPEGHYEEETMKLTVVPNRNALMLSVAYAVAASEGASLVATAVMCRARCARRCDAS